MADGAEFEVIPGVVRVVAFTAGTGIFVYCALRLVRLVRNEMRARRWTPRPAQVTSVDIRYAAGEPKSYIEYSYAGPGASPHTGRARYHGLPLPFDGLDITVYVDPEDTSRSMFDDHEYTTAYRVGLVATTVASAMLAIYALV